MNIPAHRAPMQAALHRIDEEFSGDVERALQVHVVSFFRNTVSGMWRARCSCGWISVGTEQHVQSGAAAHDLWEPVE